jgi:nucleoside-diphosphate-sugar epimerase
VEVLLSDPSRARERLGWTARVPLAEGIDRTARWLRDNLDRYRTDGFHV